MNIPQVTFPTILVAIFATLVLTSPEASAEPPQKSSVLVIGPDIEGQVLIFDAKGELVIDVNKDDSEPLEVGLRPARYSVTLRKGADHFTAEIRLGSEEPTLLSLGGFRALRPDPDPESFAFPDIDWDFGLSLSSGGTTSAVPEYDELMLHTFGLELRIEGAVLQWRLRYGHNGHDGEDEYFVDDRHAFPEYLIGTDLGLLGHWGWDWLYVQAGLRGGTDFVVKRLSTEEEGFSFPADNERLFLVIRGGVVGQAVIRPLDWLAFFVEGSTDVFLDGTVVGAGQAGVTFYMD